MRPTICLFHRNLFHNQLYPAIGSYLRSNHGWNVQHMRRVGKIAGELVFEYEREIEKIWELVDISTTHLQRLSEKYPNAELLRSIFADRGCNYFPKYCGRERVPYAMQLRYLVACLEVFERYLAENKVDYVLSDLSIGIADVLRHVCEANGVRYLAIRSSKLKPGVIFTDPDYDIPVGLAERYRAYSTTGIPERYLAAARKHIEGIRRKIETPAYMEVTRQRYKLFHWSRAKAFIENYRHKASRVTTVSFDQRPVLTSLQWNLIKLWNVWVTRLKREEWFIGTLPEGLQYYVFTLQYEPENSTAIRSFPFSNQICVIENLAKALPLGVHLVVKEHRGNQGYRKPRDYRDIWYLPNVMLVPPEYPINELIKGGLGVVTMTSRMGWEACVMGKKVIGLGKTFYSLLDEVRKPASWDELRKMLTVTDECIDTQAQQREGRLEALAAAYMSLTCEGKYVFKGGGVRSNGNIRLLSEAIIIECGKLVAHH